MIRLWTRAVTQRSSKSSTTAVLIALAAAYAGVAFAAHPSSDDGSLQAKVQAALSTDKHLYAKHIDVSVKDGVVHLAGFVATDTELQLAKKDAEAVVGVRNVSSEITIKPGASESNTSGG